MLVALLPLVFLAGPLRVEAPPDTVEKQAAVDAITRRIGDRGEDWSIVVGPLERQRAVVTLTAPDGWVLRREVMLDAEDATSRSRQLATSAALVIENYEPRPEEPVVPPAREPPPVRVAKGFVAVGARASTGPASRAAFAPGLSLAGGAWVLRDRLLPLAIVEWRRSSAGELRVDGVSALAGAAVGGGLARGRLWLGAGLVGGALGGFARDSRSASGWATHIATPLIVQGRFGSVLVDFHAGAELTLPALAFRGDADALRWGHWRALVALRVGFIVRD